MSLQFQFDHILNILYLYCSCQIIIIIKRLLMGKKNTQASKPHGQAIFQAFFSGIPYQSTEDDLKQFLGTDEGIINIKMPRYQDSNRCRGYAHIKFDNEENYKNALSKNGSNLGTRYITVSKAQGQKEVKGVPSIPVGCKTLFVKGLPYEIKQQKLKQQFGSVGIIKDIRMVRNSVNRKFKGFAYIQYQVASSLAKAIKKYHNTLYEGRRLICDATVTKMKNGYKRRNDEPDEENEGIQEDNE